MACNRVEFVWMAFVKFFCGIQCDLETTLDKIRYFHVSTTNLRFLGVPKLGLHQVALNENTNWIQSIIWKKNIILRHCMFYLMILSSVATPSDEHFYWEIFKTCYSLLFWFFCLNVFQDFTVQNLYGIAVVPVLFLDVLSYKSGMTFKQKTTTKPVRV